ncbi:MAG: ABC transporter permease [Candidatus Edwardsbacteria bacterium]
MQKIKHYLRAINAESIKEWKIELTYRVDFVRGMIEPLFWVLPFILYGVAIVGGKHSASLAKLTGTGDVITYTVIGYIFMGLLNTAVWAMGFALRKEQWFGTLESIFTTPVPRWVYVAGMATHSTAHQGLIILVQMVLVYFIFGVVLKIEGILPSLMVIAVMMIALYGLGVMVSALALIYKEGWIIAEALHTLISIVTPIAYPLAVFPEILQKIALSIPTTYGIMTVRHFLIGEKMGFSVLTGLARLLIIGIVWVAFGLSIFAIVDRKVRRDGTLAEY